MDKYSVYNRFYNWEAPKDAPLRRAERVKSRSRVSKFARLRPGTACSKRTWPRSCPFSCPLDPKNKFKFGVSHIKRYFLAEYIVTDDAAPRKVEGTPGWQGVSATGCYIRHANFTKFLQFGYFIQIGSQIWAIFFGLASDVGSDMTRDLLKRVQLAVQIYKFLLSQCYLIVILNVLLLLLRHQCLSRDAVSGL
jgi:hypothetical protein